MTRADLIARVLWNIGVTDRNETPDASDAARMGDWVDGVFAELSEMGLNWWDPAAIPASVSLALIDLISGRSCAAFGRAGRHEGGIQGALLRLQSLKNLAEHPTIKALYY